MPDTDQLDQAFRAATQDVHEAPVRANRVARLVRRRQLLAAVGLVLGAIALTAVIAGGLLAGKSAVDPSFEPPLFSGAASEIDFGEPEVVRGHTPLAAYLKATGQPTSALTQKELRAEGLVFKGSLELLGHRGQRLTPEWSVRRVRSRRRVPAPTYTDPPTVRPRSDHETLMIRAWIGPPSISGRYVVAFALKDERGKVLAQARSKSFPILAKDYFAPYRTPAYRARLPAEWRFESDYEEVAGRFVSKKLGPAGVSVLIDTTPGARGDPADSARNLEKDFRAIPGYRRLKFLRARLGPGEVFEWSFELGRQRKTDIFFYRGGDGFAVLAEGPPRRFSLIRGVAREVARSVTPTR